MLSKKPGVIRSLNEPLHDHPRRIIRGIITTLVFSHTQGQKARMLGSAGTEGYT
jgi:hypothetical protein